jgi:hypothetical protein
MPDLIYSLLKDQLDRKITSTVIGAKVRLDVDAFISGGVPIIIVPTTSGTATVTSVPSAIVSTILLVANALRLGATIQNDSMRVLYVRCGTPASAALYTVRLTSQSYWEVPAGYTGIITGIWVAPAAGAALVTEFTP